MYVCICKGVSEKQVAHAMSEGAVGIRQLKCQTRIGTQCGACRKDLRKLIRRANEYDAHPGLVLQTI